MVYNKEYYETVLKAKLKAKRDKAKEANKNYDGNLEKFCRSCQTVKPHCEFSHTPTTKNNLRSHCKGCNSKKAKERYYEKKL